MAADARGKNDVSVLNPDQMAQREYAGVFDLRIGTSNSHGYGSFGSEYIGGCSAIGWWEYFMDSTTGEVYKVHCWDGIDGGKDSHSDRDRSWLHACYRAIVMKCHTEAETGQTVIWLSRHERVIMEGFTHHGWLDTEPNEKYARQSHGGLGDDGFVGMCRGIPVVCDDNREDLLPPRN